MRYFIFFILFLTTLPVFAQNSAKYPNFGDLYLGFDRFENINRKIFIFNGVLNKFALRPVSIIWSSVMPKYGMERLKGIYSNILYPKRLVSTIIQKDFKAAKNETVRFVANSAIGLAGMFDPAKRLLKIKGVNEDMEQALAKLNVKQGPYLVVPILNSTTPRGLLGQGLDCALDPTSYIGSMVVAAVKAVFTINNAVSSQKFIKNVEKTYNDPYDIARKIYGIKTAILNSNLDRDEVIEKKEKEFIGEEKAFIEVSAKIRENGTETALKDTIKGSTSAEDILYEDELVPDIILKNFNPKHPVIDSMRTALFEIEGVNNSIWNENSVWNRSFQNRIKTDAISLSAGRDNYKFKYILQKDKSSPLAIIYPSVGEGIDSHHSIHFAKLFYDEGYSVLIQGSAFRYDFYNSQDEEYRPGMPVEDAKRLREATSKIITKIEEKNNYKFNDKVLLGTSFGAMSALFVGDLENKDNLLNISKYISINPPIELLYAVNQIDSNSEEWEKDEEKLKDKVTYTAAKVLQAANKKSEGEILEELNFNLEEAKLITGFVLHQKLADLLLAIENGGKTDNDFYKKAHNTNYKDYIERHIASKALVPIDFSKEASLYKIKNYLKNSYNYRIYHSLDDYLVNQEQLKQIKNISKSRMRLIDKGSHLGFLYRDEFLNDLKKEISNREKIGI